MSSPTCTVNGSTTGNGVNVASGSTVTIQIYDTAGVNAWSIKCLTTDDLQVAASITASLTIDAITKTATFTAPTTTVGAAMIFESKINGGLDINGRNDASLTTRFGVFVLTASGNLRVGAFDETVEGNAAFGWTAKFNAGIRSAAAAGVTPTVTGSLPIVIDNSNPAALVASINPATTSLPGSLSASDKSKLNTLKPIAPTSPIAITDVFGTNYISINPANGAAAGSMSSADKTLMDGATNAPTVNTLVKRDVNGNAAFATMFAEHISSGANLDLSCDGFGVITLDGASTGELLVPMPIRGASYKLASQANLSRSIPLNWSACKVAAVDSWTIGTDSKLTCMVQDAAAVLTIECRFPHGCKIESVSIWNTGPTGIGALPSSPPTFSLCRELLSTGVSSVVGTVNGTLDGTYRGTRRETIIALAADHEVDAALYRYYITITPEYGSDSLAGHIVSGAEADYYLPATYAIGME